MKRQFIILLSYFGYSKCEDSDKLGLRGIYLSKTNIESCDGKDFLKIDHLEINSDKDSGYDYVKEPTYELSNFEY